MLTLAFIAMTAIEPSATFTVPQATFRVTPAGCRCGPTCDCGKGSKCDCVAREQIPAPKPKVNPPARSYSGPVYYYRAPMRSGGC